jgi:hypothetical protein
MLRLVADLMNFEGWSRKYSPRLLSFASMRLSPNRHAYRGRMMVLGDTHRAWVWHDSAAVAADETGQSELGLQVRSLGILIPLYSCDSHEALSMAVEACDVGGSIVDRTLSAYVLAVTLKALILAQLGYIDECKATLHSSGASFTRLDRAARTILSLAFRNAGGASIVRGPSPNSASSTKPGKLRTAHWSCTRPM